MAKEQLSLDLLAGPSQPEAASPHIFSVSEINKEIRSILETGFSLIWIRGEISNFKPHSSGHHYFSLKDRGGQINAVMFRGFNTHLKFKPADGMEVLVRGKVTVYEPRGTYQIFCEVMEPVGQGALQMAYEQLKKKLQSEGLFELSRKRTLPSLPQRVAIVTSPTGAAIRDMLNVLSRRFRGLEITIFPTAVQGATAAREIATAIKLANQIGGFDVMIVGRGGGSIEDLWAFNEEIVARAIAASNIPTVSAVGHEVDFTIADFVADLRAPTPSAAAELVVKNASDLGRQIQIRYQQIVTATKKQLNFLRQRTVGSEKRLVDPKRRLQDLIMKCDELDLRLEAAVERRISDLRGEVVLCHERLGTPSEQIMRHVQRIRSLFDRLRLLQEKILQRDLHKVARSAALLDSLSPLRVLDRGFSIATKEGHIVRSISEVKIADRMQLKLRDGRVDVEVLKIEKEE